jgi:hypothetical protein
MVPVALIQPTIVPADGLEPSYEIPFDLSEVMETSVDTLRYSTDGTKVLLKWVGTKPAFLAGQEERTHAQIKADLDTPDWRGADPGE